MDAPIRGFIDRIQAVTIPPDDYLSLKALASYSGLSVKSLRALIDRPAEEALPCYRLPGKLLVRRSEFDEYLSRFRTVGRPSLTKALDDLGLSRPNTQRSAP